MSFLNGVLFTVIAGGLIWLLHHYPVCTKVIVSREGNLHFKRWCWFWTPWFAIYTHYIARSDEDKHPHSHPWSFLSLILKGSYIEELYDANERTGIWITRCRRGIGSLSYRNKNLYHKISLESPVYSLVFVGPKAETWGYLKDGCFVEHTEYRRLKNELRDSAS